MFSDLFTRSFYSTIYVFKFNLIIDKNIVIDKLGWILKFQDNLIVGIRILNEFAVSCCYFDLLVVDQSINMFNGTHHTIVVNIDCIGSGEMNHRTSGNTCVRQIKCR